jgi:hypothetical protein
VGLQERYQQLDFRLAHLLQCNTAELMALTAGPADSGSGDEDDGVIDQPGSNNGSSSSSSNRTSGKKDKLLYRLLPDTLWWMQHREQFNLMRNEGEQPSQLVSPSLDHQAQQGGKILQDARRLLMFTCLALQFTFLYCVSIVSSPWNALLLCVWCGRRASAAGVLVRG